MKVSASGYTTGNILVYKFQNPSALSNSIVRRGAEIAAVMATSLRTTEEMQCEGKGVELVRLLGHITTIHDCNGKLVRFISASKDFDELLSWTWPTF